MLLSIGGETASGATVSPETALRCPAVLGAVRAIAETVASTPCRIFRRTKADGRELAKDHPLWPILTEAANPWTPAYEFFLLLTQDFTLYGNAFAWVSRDADGAVTELVRLLPARVVVYVDPLTLEPVYKYTGLDGVQHEWDRTEVLHLRGVGAVSMGRGDSPVDLAREAIGVSVVMEAHAAGLFGRGARPAGVLKGAGKMTEEVMRRLRASFEGMYKGGANAGRTAILEEGWEFQPLQLSSTDAQFLEMRKFQIQEIARTFRVPLHLLAEMDNVHYSTAEAMGAQFLAFGLLPIFRMWRDAIHLTLLSADERKTLYVDFDTDHIARADLAARFTAYSQAINGGFLSPNEVRAEEGLPPYAGGETFMRPVNTAPAPTTGGPTIA
ncbi:phage portal protein [Azospirillum sp. sgz301742]